VNEQLINDFTWHLHLAEKMIYI